MKYFLCLCVCIIGFGFFGRSQDFQGMAIYQSKTTLNGDFGPPDMPESRRQELRQRLQKDLEKSYELSFDRTASLYLEQEKLEAPEAGGGFRVRMGMNMGGGTYYKNVAQGYYVHQMETMGKNFLIKDSLAQWHWTLGSETKKIGNYTCYKATAVKAVDSTDFDNMRRMFRPNRNREPSTKDTVARDSTKGNSLLSRIEAPKETVITAWFAPEIPIGQGPGPYWGLPGLILEVNDGRTAILCSKIVLNAEVKKKIEAPSKGKEVGQKEYDQMVMERMKEMSERFRNGNRRGGGRPGPPR